MEVFPIYVSEDRPPIRLLYINNMHSTDSWIKMVELSCCKLNLFIEGVSTIIVSGKPFVTTAGDIIIYRPHELHYGCIPYPQNIEYFELLFEPDTFSALSGGRDFIRLFEVKPDEMPSLTQMRLPEDVLFPIRKRFYALLDMVRQHDHNNVIALSLLIDLMNRIVLASKTSFVIDEPDSYPAILVQALDFIGKHYQDDIDNRIISSSCCVSMTYLNRLFRRFLQCTPHEYVLSCRLAQAKSLLGSGKTVTETCYTAGFRDCSSFGKVFRNAVGLTPSEYRKQQSR